MVSVGNLLVAKLVPSGIIASFAPRADGRGSRSHESSFKPAFGDVDRAACRAADPPAARNTPPPSLVTVFRFGNAYQAR